MDLISKAVRTAITSTLSDGMSSGTIPENGRYDRLIDGINRLPRPALAFGAIAVFLFAMLDPAGFAQRMTALKAAPPELWWILGAVIATHFGARETHHLRHRRSASATIPPESFPPDQAE